MIKMRLIVLLFFLLYSESFPQYVNAPYFYNYQMLDINKIKMPLDNYGGAYPRSHFTTYHDSIGKIVYDHGLFFIGKISDSIYESHVLWESLFSPGPIINGKPAMEILPSDSLRYAVYKISSGDTTNIDSLSNYWPYDLGAPLSENQKPVLYADQTLWSVYNACDSNSILPKTSTRRTKYPVFPLEVQHTAYSYQSGFDETTEFLDETIFIEWTIINKGSLSIDSASLGLWTDIDFIGENNYPAIDTANQLGYCWTNWDTTQTWYDQTKLPAVGYIMLYGPVATETGSVAIFRGKEKIGYKNLSLSAFWGIHDDSFSDSSNFGPAYSKETAWNISGGLDKKGNQIIDPTTNQPTKFRYAGDPITNTGWLSTSRKTSGGAGFYMFTGPFNMAPQDTQWVMFALTAAQDGDNLKSITELRRRANVLHQFEYNELVKQSEIEVYDPNPPSPNLTSFVLYQNYPNPFNPKTTIEYEVPEKSFVTIKIYDILGREVQTLVNNQEQVRFKYKVVFDASSFPSGVYFYRLQAGSFTETKKMVVIK